MLKFAAVVGVGAMSAAAVAGAVMAYADTRLAAPAQVESLEAQPIANTSAPTPAQISKGPDGHYWAQASVNGRAVRFLVDTGATAVALTADDARRLGIDLSKLDYRVKVTTADGQTRAAQVKLQSVSIAGARVDNVDALVLESGLETSLLGMSYLGRLTSFEATRTALILKP